MDCTGQELVSVGQANSEERMETLSTEISVLFSGNSLFEPKASWDFLRMYLTERAVLSVCVRRSLLTASTDTRFLAVSSHISFLYWLPSRVRSYISLYIIPHFTLEFYRKIRKTKRTINTMNFTYG